MSFGLFSSTISSRPLRQTSTTTSYAVCLIWNPWVRPKNFLKRTWAAFQPPKAAQRRLQVLGRSLLPNEASCRNRKPGSFGHRHRDRNKNRYNRSETVFGNNNRYKVAKWNSFREAPIKSSSVACLANSICFAYMTTY